MAKAIWFACKKTADCHGHTHYSHSGILLDDMEKSKIEAPALQSTNFMHSNRWQPLMYIPMAKAILFACKKTTDCHGHYHYSHSGILLDAIEKSRIEAPPLQSTNFMHSNSCQPLMYIPMAKAIWFACKKTTDCHKHTHSSHSVILLDAIQKWKIEA